MYDDRAYQAGREDERERLRLLIAARVQQLRDLPRTYRHHRADELLLLHQALDL